jgi:diguanylate cyclase (GGDEF)-like protein/putative nucleotidyltransferase with HDIG domain
VKNVPTAARWFLILAYILGALSAELTYLGVALTDIRGPFWELTALALLAIVSGSKKVTLIRVRNREESGCMSLGFLVIFATLLRFGPPGAILVGALSTLFSCLLPRRFPWYQLLFNMAVNLFQTLTASMVFVELNGGTIQLHAPDSIPAVVASCLTFFFVNTGMVSTIIGLCSGRDPYRIWREAFLWTAPSYFVAAAISMITVLVLGERFPSTLLCATPVGFLTLLSYNNYVARNNALLESKEQLANLYLATVRSLALAIDAKDQFTHQHILRVQQYAVAIAKQMGLSGDDLTAIETSALLHDIGKLGVPEYVLLKPGRLTEEEFAKIKEHPRIGADILDPVPFPWPVLPGVKHHHEKWDGTGYPDGLQGEDIPLQGRILAVADVYDALTSNRSYRNAWTHEKAVAEVCAGAGTHFDPRVVAAFLEVIDDLVAQMAAEGTGPKVGIPSGAIQSAEPPRSTRADVAARDIQRAASELWALYEVAQTLSSSLGLKETLDILARKIAAIMPDTACLFLLRKESDEGVCDFGRHDLGASELFHVRTAVGTNHAYFTNGRTSNANSLSMKVARSRTAYLGTFDVEDLVLVAQPAQALSSQPWIPFNTALIVPIVHQGGVLGTINLYHALPEAFSLHEKQLLEMIAERAAMAIHNGLLFDRMLCDAMTDPLTGLANIRVLTEHMARHSGREDRQPFTLLCLDLDSFKPINDNFGHQQGDRVLRELSTLFRRMVRAEDIVIRYGGDEFLILLQNMDEEAALTIETQLRRAVSQYDTGLYHPRIGSIRLGVSIGIGAFPDDGADAATLISVADSRMNQDKAERKLLRMRINTGTSLSDDVPPLSRTARKRAIDVQSGGTASSISLPDNRNIRQSVMAGAQEETRCRI